MARKVILVLVVSIISILFYLAATSNNPTNKDCDLIADQNAKDDCYHSLAHETNNGTICNKISNSEKKEHCFGHVPE